MALYTVSFPATAIQVFSVEASSEDEAIERVLSGEAGDSEIEDIECDFDSNLAEVNLIEK